MNNMTNNLYILDENGKPTIEHDMMKWAKWVQESESRRVGLEKIGDVKVSTVFLGIDHNFSKDGPPVLWETMVFGGDKDQEMERCSGGREQAEAMHLKMVETIKDYEHTKTTR